MSQTIQISAKSAALFEIVEAKTPASRSFVEQMRELRLRVKPDPEGWAIKDYINYGRP